MQALYMYELSILAAYSANYISLSIFPRQLKPVSMKHYRAKLLVCLQVIQPIVQCDGGVQTQH